MDSSEIYTADSYLVTHHVDVGHTGTRLDAFLKERYRKRSRAQIQRAIDEGAITIQRRQGPHLSVGRLKPGSTLIGGDDVLVRSERKPEPDVCFNYRIIFEDETLLIIDKPANLPVHPAGRYFFNTLLIHLRTNGHRSNMLSDEREYFLVHRIDKETSGVLVLTKDKDVCTKITKQFAERTTAKRYLAIARGVTPESFVIDAPLMRATNSIIELKMAVASESAGGQPSFTEFRRLSVHTNKHGEFSLVECLPKTGRQHQIRVHLEAAGHPIVGDKLYGIPEDEALRFYERRHLTPEAQARLLLPRHALHAASIRFIHPITEREVEFRSELPNDLSDFLAPETPNQ
jgi:23S rRNA pseudouridine1911/1915/1917 synthase